jgi:hypothetical protein
LNPKLYNYNNIITITMPEYTLQQYINSHVVIGTKQTLEAGGSLLTFDKTAQTATFKDPDGNTTVFNASPPQYSVLYGSEQDTAFQKNFFRILETTPSRVNKIQLIDPTEAFF